MSKLQTTVMFNCIICFVVWWILHFRPKQSIFGPKMGHSRQLVPENGPPSSRTGTYRKTESIQSYLMTTEKSWSHWVGSVWGEKGGDGYMGIVLKKKNFGPKIKFFAQNPFLCVAIQIFCYHHNGAPKRQGFCVEPARGASGRLPRPVFGPKIFIFYATPI